jgi:DNA-binding transcriptional LysR family regulator
MANLDDLTGFVAVARAGGFREAARVNNTSASSLSEAVTRLEAKLGLHHPQRRADGGRGSPARASGPGARRGGSSP